MGVFNDNAPRLGARHKVRQRLSGCSQPLQYGIRPLRFRWGLLRDCSKIRQFASTPDVGSNLKLGKEVWPGWQQAAGGPLIAHCRDRALCVAVTSGDELLASRLVCEVAVHIHSGAINRSSRFNSKGVHLEACLPKWTRPLPD